MCTRRSVPFYTTPTAPEGVDSAVGDVTSANQPRAPPEHRRAGRVHARPVSSYIQTGYDKLLTPCALKTDCCPFRTIVAATIVAVGLIFDVHHLLEGPLARLIGSGVEAAGSVGMTLDRHARATGEVQAGMLAGGLGGLAVAVTGFLALRS